MFSRRWTLIVLGAWVFLTGWFLLRDLRPLVQVSEPAPFRVTVGDEPRLSLTGTIRQRLVEAPWLVIRNETHRNAGFATLRVVYDQWSDALEFKGEFKVRSANLRRFGSPWLEVDSTFRVDWEGRLQELDCEIRVRRESLLLANPTLIGLVVGAWMPGLTEHVPEWPLLRGPPVVALELRGPPVVTPEGGSPPSHNEFSRPQMDGSRRFSAGPTRGGGGVAGTGRFLADSPLNLYTDQELSARCRARVRNGSLLPQWRITGEQRDPMFQPVELSRRGHVLLPFHPLNRMPDLATGQRWRVPMLDLEAAVNLDRTREVRLVTAEVTGPEPLTWQSREIAVYVVTFRDDERELVRVWVRQQDLLVLRQEFTFSSDHYRLERMPDR